MNPDTRSLEGALRLAATDPSARPDFYRMLLEAEVLVIGDASPRPSGKWEAKAGESISLQHWSKPDGSMVLPFFSSIEALQRALDEEVTYYQLPARALFEMTQGATLVLDPRSEYGKEFVPGEITALLAGGLTREAQRHVMQEHTQVLLAQPKEPPTALIDGVSAFLAKRPSVRRAWLGLMTNPAVGPEPNLVIGIEAEGDPDQVFPEIGNVAADLSDGRAIDLIQVREGDDGLSQYFLQGIEPFYRRG